MWYVGVARIRSIPYLRRNLDAAGAHRHGTWRSNVLKERPWSEEARSFDTNSALPMGGAGVLLLVHHHLTVLPTWCEKNMRPAGCPCDPETWKRWHSGLSMVTETREKRHHWKGEREKNRGEWANLNPISETAMRLPSSETVVDSTDRFWGLERETAVPEVRLKYAAGWLTCPIQLHESASVKTGHDRWTTSLHEKRVTRQCRLGRCYRSNDQALNTSSEREKRTNLIRERHRKTIDPSLVAILVDCELSDEIASERKRTQRSENENTHCHFDPKELWSKYTSDRIPLCDMREVLKWA